MGHINRTGDAEYLLQVTPHVNERTRRPTTLIVLRTVKSFASFRYELAVEEHREGKTIHLKILGLKAPQLDLPAAGPAEFRREYESLKGNYLIVVQGLDGSTTPVAIRVTQRHVALTAPVARGIIEVDIA